MRVALEMHDVAHVEMFSCLSQLVRGLVNLAGSNHAAAVHELDQTLEAGAVVRLTFSLGSAGPLALVLQGIGQNGSTHDLVTIDAPPSPSAFRFGPGKG